MGGAKKRNSEESLFCVATRTAPAIEYRDVYVHYSTLHKRSFASLKDSTGGIYRIHPHVSLGAGPPTRVHYENSCCDMRFSEDFKRTIEQVHVNLYLMESNLIVSAQIVTLWRLLATFPGTVKKVVVRLSDPEEPSLEVGERIPESMIYDDSTFFDVAKVTKLCRVFENVELHTKCNAIGSEHVVQLVEFFNTYNFFRRLVIYISEFKLFLNSISVTETDGKFKSLNAKVKVTQFGQLVTVRIGALRIHFEDEFQALEFKNYD